MIQTILGSGGAIGTPLARELTKYNTKIRLVSRNPRKVNPTDELHRADLSDPKQVDRAVEGSDVVYVTAGFKYDIKVWQRTWPPFIGAVLDACRKHGSKLVFFDNIYLYASSAIPHMTEESPIDPPSRKGRVRQELHEMIMQDVEADRVNALIIRAADFYGPENQNSALKIMVADNLLKGKKAQVMGDMDRIHTYTFTPDAAKATALLGNTEEAYNQVWHAPTTKERLTNRQWMKMIAEEFGQDLKTQRISRGMLRMLGLVVPVLKEFPEMIYQYEQDYVLDSSKIEKRFGMKATRPMEGVKVMTGSMIAARSS
jgi:nucleoside-diphosphate-sugar epimerase